MTPIAFTGKNEKKDTAKERRRFGGGSTLKPVGVSNSATGRNSTGLGVKWYLYVAVCFLQSLREHEK